jgi:hypothetical protein
MSWSEPVQAAVAVIGAVVWVTTVVVAVAVAVTVSLALAVAKALAVASLAPELAMYVWEGALKGWALQCLRLESSIHSFPGPNGK